MLRSRLRQVGAVGGLLLFGSSVAVVLLARYKSADAASLATVLALPITVLACYFAYLAVALATKHDHVQEMRELVDEFADVVRGQWEHEAELRRLNDPQPLPVSWVASDPTLFEDWSQLLETRSGWPGASSSDDSALWEAGAEELEGTGNQIADVLLERTPTRRLVVLGAPGAGKTMLLVRLVLDMLAKREAGDLVPVLLSVASWNARKDALDDWLIARLQVDYDGLSKEVRTRSGVTTAAQALVSERRIFLILDGLDEIPRKYRRSAITRINDFLRPNEGVVVSSRERAYSEAVAPTNGTSVKLRAATGITLLGLDASTIQAYLERDAGGPPGAERWQSLFAELYGDGPIASAFRTPLMVSLARVIYNPRSDEGLEGVRHPDELCDTSQFTSEGEIRAHLFDAYIPSAYRRPSRGWRKRYTTPARAVRWLRFLAKHLERDLHGTTDIAWWELSMAAPPGLAGIVIGLVAGIASGVVATTFDPLGIGIGSGMLAGLAVGGAIRQQWGHVGGLASGPAAGIIGGLLGGITGALVAVATGSADSITQGIGGPAVIGAAVGATTGVVGGLVGGFAGGAVNGLLAGAGHGVAAGLVDGVAIGLAAGLIVSMNRRTQPVHGLRWSPVGLAAGSAVGLVFGVATALGVGVQAGVLGGTASGLGAALVAGLVAGDADTVGVAGPREVLRRDQQMLLAIVIALGAVVGFGNGLAVGLSNARDVVLGLGIGIASFLISGLAIGLTRTGSGSYIVAHLWLAAKGDVPLRLMRFLQDAHEKRGVLRRVGAVYQFRHAELQHRLSDAPATNPVVNEDDLDMPEPRSGPRAPDMARQD